MDTPYFHNKGIVEAFKAGIYYLRHFVLFVFISCQFEVHWQDESDNSPG